MTKIIAATELYEIGKDFIPDGVYLTPVEIKDGVLNTLMPQKIFGRVMPIDGVSADA